MRAASFLITCLLALVPSVARAEGRVALDGDEQDTLTARVARELALAGLERGAAADPDLPRIEVAPGEVRYVPVGEPPRTWPRAGGDDPSLALAVVEAVRADLAAAPASDAPAEDALDEPAPPRAPIFSAWLLASAQLSPGGIDPLLALAIGGEVRVVWRAYVELFAQVVLPEAYLAQKRFEFGFWTGLFGAGFGASLLEDAEPVALRAAIGLAVQPTVLDGERTTWAAVPYLRVAFSVRLIDALAIRADAAVGAALPEHDLRFRAGFRATYGLPIASFGIGLELDL
ncbi:MAG: hypothetical protein AB7S26_19710 [Sandaracinaceae bacterium]